MLSLDHPVVVGISGPAGAGKTSTAVKLAPTQARYLDDYPRVVFDHFFLAAPIYDLVGAKRHILGVDKQDRQLYRIHRVLDELMANRISYDDLVELVYDIYMMDAGRDGESKPRTFMQTVGDMCREKYVDCFVDLTVTKIYTRFYALKREYADAGIDYDPIYIALVSDTRRLNEFSIIKDLVNGHLVRLEASPEVRRERLLERDGVLLNEVEAKHPTETEAENIPLNYFDFILDTDSISLEDQAIAVWENLMDTFAPEVRAEEAANG